VPLAGVILLFAIWTITLKKQVRKKTEALQKELGKRIEIQQKLEISEMDLMAQNEEYETINEELMERSREIEWMNKELIQAKNRAEENDHLKTTFLANMSHEIRTPMNGIIGFCELIETDIDESERILYAGIIAQGAHRLLHLLNDIIDISKIETGQVNFEYKTFNLNKLVNDWASFYALQATQKGLQFKGEENHEEVTLYSDEQRLGQVLNNLLSNAIKHTEKGYVSIYFDLFDDYVKVWVRDSGKGISVEEQAFIFNRFYQGTRAPNIEQKGTGLGLAIAHSIVTLLGGKIGVESTPEKGSTFWFTHPLTKE